MLLPQRKRRAWCTLRVLPLYAMDAPVDLVWAAHLMPVMRIDDAITTRVRLCLARPAWRKVWTDAKRRVDDYVTELLAGREVCDAVEPRLVIPPFEPRFVAATAEEYEAEVNRLLSTRYVLVDEAVKELMRRIVAIGYPRDSEYRFRPHRGCDAQHSALLSVMTERLRFMLAPRFAVVATLGSIELGYDDFDEMCEGINLDRKRSIAVLQGQRTKVSGYGIRLDSTVGHWRVNGRKRTDKNGREQRRLKLGWIDKRPKIRESAGG